MKLKVFSVYDSKAEAYLQPFFMPSRGSAIRAFTDSVNDPQTGFHKHAADYTLFELGEYEDSNAVFDLHQKPQLVANAAELKEKPITTAPNNNMIDMKGDY